MTPSHGDDRLILLTGATGYVGGRLLDALEQSGRRVRCLARRPEFLRPRVGPGTEVAAGDVLDESSVAAALRGVHTAYYLVHSMALGSAFEARDREAAALFARCAERAGVRRIIYLGGLGGDAALSTHLSSRQEVGRILRESRVPTIEFRASIIIGSGSLSFEMIRSLVDRLPIMVTPRWVRTLAQPIAIEDVIAFLLAALDYEGGESVVFDIGGRDRAAYLDIMREYARQRGLRRRIIPVPVLTPRLSSLWLGFVTPVFARIGRHLIDGIRNETIVRDDRANRTFGIQPRGIHEAIARALVNEDEAFARTRWSDAVSSGRPLRPSRVGRVGPRFVDSRSVRVPYPPARAFRPIRRIGGEQGWYFADWLWQIRGVIDLVVGGVGMRRGRRDPDRLAPGDTVDFWRVDAFEPDRLLRLTAEMRLPGRAWLQFEVKPCDGGSVVCQTAIFEPNGLGGMLYWYGLYMAHGIIFTSMLRNLVRAMDESAAGPAPHVAAGVLV